MVRPNIVAPLEAATAGVGDLRALNRTAAVRRMMPWVAFFGLTLLVLVIGVTVGARALIGSFEQVESAATAQKASQVYRAFEADLRQLAISNRDYAQWPGGDTQISRLSKMLLRLREDSPR